LLLIPAGFLALLVLAALAFDQARVLGMRRELLDIAGSTASDAAAATLDRGSYYHSGGLVGALSAGQLLLDEQLSTRGLTGRVTGRVLLADGPDGPTVVVELTATATSLFARMAPGGWSSTDVHVRSSAALDSF
jgi:hypothetical protein